MIRKILTNFCFNSRDKKESNESVEFLHFTLVNYSINLYVLNKEISSYEIYKDLDMFRNF